MAPKQTQHAVIGTGAGLATATAIKEGLLDVLDDHDVVGVIWKKPIPPALEWVYDFIVDNSVPFVMYYDEANTIPPRVFREAEHGSVQKSRNPELAALNAITGAGKVLFLWDDAENPGEADPAQDLIEWVFDSIDPGTIVLELSNGLRPITAVGVIEKDLIDDLANETKGRYDDDDVDPLDALAADLPGDTDAPVLAEADPTIGPFSRDELLNMPAANVKRYGDHVGAAAKTKAGIIDELYPLDPVVKSPGVTIMEDAIEANEAEVEATTIMDFTFNDPAYTLFRRSLKVLGGPSDVKEIFEDLARAVIARAPVSRERSLVFTKLEEAHHWAVKAVMLTGDLPEV